MWVEIDVETSGRKSPQARILEVAAIVLDEHYREIDHFECLANPGQEAMRAADPESLRINGITSEMVQKAPPSEVVARNFNLFLDRFWGATFHAFNNEFDQWFLEQPPWGIRSQRWGECVMNAAMKVMNRAGALGSRLDGGPKWPKLSEAATFFKVPSGDAHRALEDCRTLGRVHAEILRRRDYETTRRMLSDEAVHVMDQGL